MKKLILLIALLFPTLAFAVNPASYTPDPIVAFARIQQALPAIQAGNATLNTDGKGIYWVSKKAFDPSSGVPLPDITIPVDVTSARAALPVLQQFIALTANATVASYPVTAAPQSLVNAAQLSAASKISLQK